MWEVIPDTAGEGTNQGWCPTGPVGDREGLVADVIVGDPLGHSGHEMVEFLVLRQMEGWQQNCCLGLPEGRLCLGAGLAESLGRQP